MALLPVFWLAHPIGLRGPRLVELPARRDSCSHAPAEKNNSNALGKTELQQQPEQTLRE